MYKANWVRKCECAYLFKDRTANSAWLKCNKYQKLKMSFIFLDLKLNQNINHFKMNEKMRKKTNLISF